MGTFEFYLINDDIFYTVYKPRSQFDVSYQNDIE